MIAYLNGKILQKNERSILLETNCVGYEVFTTTNVLSEIAPNDTLELYIYTHVREDEITLYGFTTHSELKFFKLLLSVKGIGPRLGLEIISAPIGLVKNAIYEGDPATLTKIKGLGKKTAERMILELKNTIEPVFETEREHRNAFQCEINTEAVEALQSLGYSKYQVMKVLRNMDAEIEKTEDMIKYFLQNV